MVEAVQANGLIIAREGTKVKVNGNNFRRIYGQKAAAAGKSVFQAAEGTTEKAIEETAKKTGFWAKFGKNILKGGAIALGILGLGLGGYFLYKKLTDKDKTPAAEDITKPAEVKEPEKEPEQTGKPAEDNEKSQAPDVKGEPKKPTPGVVDPDSDTYIVVSGDNVWNIAKKDLIAKNKDKAGYKPTNAEIAKRTQELLKINNLHYESDNYRVLIYPDQELKLK